uniref:Acyl-CoA-binding domain-containing protein 6 n=2 Tax=Schistocephalus solidus TaxID=70667 RepID=A0A0X3NV74_SCHSO
MFSKAASYLQEVANSLTSDQLLFFYARFKQATEGVCNKPDPGFLQPKARQKWRAWKALADMPPGVAQREYVEKMNEIVPDWSKSSDFSKPQGQFGPRVSRLAFNEDEDKQADMGQLVPLVELVKDGELEPVNEFLKLHPDSINEVDSDGLTALHWACDRGFYEIVLTLLNHGADVNALTSDEQSPLHYASCCEHEQVTRLLLERGADKNLRDADGDTPSLQFLS